VIHWYTGPDILFRRPEKAGRYASRAEGLAAMRYDVFLSYHRDSDERIAIALERALKRFAKPVFRLRALEVFRDDAALDATPAIWGQISAILTESRHFVLIASEGAAASPWVGREIQYWLETHPPERLMIALSRGVIFWSEETGDFDWERTTALPLALGRRFAEEPRWIDLRWASAATDLSLSDQAFQSAVADIAAPVHGRAKDTLIGEDVAHHRRVTHLTRLAISALALLVVGLSLSLGYAVVQRDEAERQAMRAEAAAREAIGRQLALEARVIQRELSGSIAAERAAALAIESWKMQPSRNAYEAAVTALEELPIWQYPVDPDDYEQSTAVGFLPQDGRIVHTSDVSGTGRGRLSLWSPDGTEEFYRRDLPGQVWDMAISPAGKRIALAIFDGPILIMNSEDGAEVARIDFGTDVRALSFSPDGQRLLIGTEDRGAGLFDSGTGALLAAVATDRPATAFAFAPDGQTFAVASDLSHYIDDEGEYQWLEMESARLTIFEGESFEATQDLIQPYRINAVAFAPDGALLATASIDGTARVLEVATLKERYQVMHDAAVQSVAFSGDGTRLATSSTDTTARLVRAETGEELFRVPHSRGASIAVFSPDDRYLATGSQDGGVRLVETGSGREVARMEHLGWVRSVVFSPDGRRILTQAGGQAARLQVVADGGQELAFEGGSPVTAIAYSPDGRHLVAVDAGGTLRMLETGGLTLVWTRRHDDPLWDVAFGPDGARVATVGEDGHLRIFAAADGAQLLDANLGRSLLGVAFHPDGSHIATGSRLPAVMQLLDAESDARLLAYEYVEPHGEGVCCLAFNASGSRLAIGTPTGIFRVLRGDDLEEVAVKALTGQVIAVVSDTAERIFAIGTDDSRQHMFRPSGDSNTGFVRIFAQADGTELQAFEYGAAIYAVDLDPAGSLVASGSSKGVGRIVRLEDGLELARVTTPAPITAIRFAPDGEYFATGTLEGRIETWSMPETAMRRLCTNRIGRNLSSEEWNRYLGVLRPWSRTCERWSDPRPDDKL
jgi:WD40 repeat protein